MATTPTTNWGQGQGRALAAHRCADKLTAMVEAGAWGRAYAANIFTLASAHAESRLPLGGLGQVRKLYVYLNADATLVINGCRLPMRVTREGYWELLADMSVQSLGLQVEGLAATGKYCVFGSL